MLHLYSFSQVKHTLSDIFFHPQDKTKIKKRECILVAKKNNP